MCSTRRRSPAVRPADCSRRCRITGGRTGSSRGRARLPRTVKGRGPGHGVGRGSPSPYQRPGLDHHQSGGRSFSKRADGPLQDRHRSTPSRRGGREPHFGRRLSRHPRRRISARQTPTHTDQRRVLRPRSALRYAGWCGLGGTRVGTSSMARRTNLPSRVRCW